MSGNLSSLAECQVSGSTFHSLSKMSLGDVQKGGSYGIFVLGRGTLEFFLFFKVGCLQHM